ncbi:MAG: DNA starvation/stationary phase protection protein [Bacteroidales bacterium]|jgi:starvation-inducible DNA-binding protein|nr:DNA starvation/stationary phase protection protein [Bacteroidales bacterium]MDD2263906.1 DNA starvation/stationary phase protection protein [Bacteroidales bacterium]MDD2831140.1 DNA starvation/stationary phase protection protein [Bacteroidales bacterium]MDD3209251.1 DNA starvation/stationary phase protection protein [Bacteroidales bacterium]MDD3697622.1 DNA starvation/stationary phase protection protein [Bacteroidales bacterium]
METLDYISLNKKGILPVVEELQKLLADIQIFYTNLRGFHWNVKGKQFFMLHEKFEEIYDDMNEKADQVAERILMLGHTPANNYSEYLKISQIKEVSGMSDGKEIIEVILDSFKMLMLRERTVLEKTGKVNDEVTVAMMSDYLKEQEKTVWMLVATLGG